MRIFGRIAAAALRLTDVALPPAAVRRTDSRRLAFPKALVCLALAVLPFLSQAEAQTPSQSLRKYVAACDAGDIAACSRAGLVYSDLNSTDYDSFISLRFLQKACVANDGAACGRLALIYYDGEGDVERDWSAAAKFSQDACNVNDRDGCDVAEAIFADSNSPFFDAARALRFRKINCSSGRWESCTQFARILYNVGDYHNAEQIAAHACGTSTSPSPERKEICDLRV